MLPTLSRSASMVIGQALIKGAVVDDATNLPITTPLTVRLLDRAPAQPVEFNPADYGLRFKQTPTGRFAFFGDPQAAFPDRTIVAQWQVEVRAAGYQAATRNFVFGPLTLKLATIQPAILNGDSFTVSLFDGNLPLTLATIRLIPIP